jgi:hypothetical protein
MKFCHFISPKKIEIEDSRRFTAMASTKRKDAQHDGPAFHLSAYQPARSMPIILSGTKLLNFKRYFEKRSPFWRYQKEDL